MLVYPGRMINREVAGAEFSPLQVPGLVAWWQFYDDGTVTLNGPDISQVADKSGNGFNANQNTAANQPLYELNVLNGRNAGRFANTEYLGDAVMRGGAIDDIWAGGGFVGFSVIPRATITNNRRFFNANRWFVRTTAVSGSNARLTFDRSFNGGSSGEWQTTGTAVTVDTAAYVSIAYDEDNVANDPVIEVDGTVHSIVENNTPTGNPISDSANNKELGSSGNNTAPMSMFESFWYSQIPSAGDQAALRTYAMGALGI